MNLQENIHRIKQMMGLLVEGKQVGLLYHNTFIQNAIEIIQSNKLKKNLIINNMATDYRYKMDDFIFVFGFPVHKNYNNLKHFISFTRNKSYQRNDKNQNVQFILDGDKLSQKYKITPHSHFGGRKYDEMEERVYETITNLDKYIIDIIYNGDDPKIREIINNYLNK
jgi:hypothetical protein